MCPGSIYDFSSPSQKLHSSKTPSNNVSPHPVPQHTVIKVYGLLLGIAFVDIVQQCCILVMTATSFGPHDTGSLPSSVRKHDLRAGGTQVMNSDLQPSFQQVCIPSLTDLQDSAVKSSGWDCRSQLQEQIPTALTPLTLLLCPALTMLRQLDEGNRCPAKC